MIKFEVGSKVRVVFRPELRDARANTLRMYMGVRGEIVGASDVGGFYIKMECDDEVRHFNTVDLILLDGVDDD